MHCVYVYYRVDLTQVELAAARIDTLQQELVAHCGLAPRRLNRCDDTTTWMEVYENIPDFDGFLAAIDKGVESLRCAEFTVGDRHLECFTHPGALRSPAAG